MIACRSPWQDEADRFCPAGRVPPDPRLAVMLEKLKRFPDPSTLSVADVRSSYKWRQPEGLRIDTVASTADVAIPGGPGVRIYTPVGAGPFPVLLFFHGSGFVACDLDTHDPMARNFCAAAHCLVISVDYRLAPEHRFPAASDDCIAAARWAADNAARFGGDPRRIAVFGDSAGGNLAAVTALRLRDEGGPMLCGQLLAYPVTDHYSHAYASYDENGEGYGLTPATMRWFWDHYLGGGANGDDPRASPIRAESLAGLPPAYVMTAGYDILRDEGRAYAARLAAAGVPVELAEAAALHHGFLFFPGVIGGASEALDAAAAWLRTRFAEAGA